MVHLVCSMPKVDFLALVDHSAGKGYCYGLLCMNIVLEHSIYRQGEFIRRVSLILVNHSFYSCMLEGKHNSRQDNKPDTERQKLHNSLNYSGVTGKLAPPFHFS